MEIRIKTVFEEPLNYETPWACAFDFRCSEEITINPGEYALVETWTVVETPEWYVLLTAPRSSTFKKFWLIQVNSCWIIDQDYCWDNDTIKFPFMNMRKEPVTLKYWERIWQWMIVKIEKPRLIMVDSMWNKERWGFWTTWYN